MSSNNQQRCNRLNTNIDKTQTLEHFNEMKMNKQSSQKDVSPLNISRSNTPSAT